MRNKITSIIPILFLFARLTASGANVTLAWDAETDPTVAGYNLYAGGHSQVYTNIIDAAKSTSVTVSNLSPGVTYYFSVTAYTIAGLESQFSAEASYTVPANSTNTPVFTLQPKSSTNNFGSSLTLSASAGTNVAYRWLFNSQPISGARSNFLTLPFLTWTNNGIYTLRASNSAGVSVSAPATITVTPPPVSNVRVVGP